MTRTTTKYAITTLALVVLGATAAMAQAPTRLRTAVIDVQRILAESEAGKIELAQLKKLEEEKSAQLQKMEAEINKAKERKSK